jgi:hypothetical protein
LSVKQQVTKSGTQMEGEEEGSEEGREEAATLAKLLHVN